METPIVVLDEPTTGQDARGFERIGTIVDELREAGRTVIAISHDMRFVAERFGRVFVMRAGEVILDGTPEDVFGEPNWPALASTFLEPPYAARLGAQLGLGRRRPTPPSSRPSASVELRRRREIDRVELQQRVLEWLLAHGDGACEWRIQ